MHEQADDDRRRRRASPKRSPTTCWPPRFTTAPTSGDEAKDDLRRHLVARYRGRARPAADEHDPVFGAVAGLRRPARRASSRPRRRRDADRCSAAKARRRSRVQPARRRGLRRQAARVAAGGGRPLRRAALAGSTGADKRPDADEEALRQALYGDGAPLAVPDGERLAPVQDRRRASTTRALLRKVDEWNATSPDAPPRAMVLVDSPAPHDSPVLLRGNPANPGPVVPRHFLAVLSRGTPQPFTQGSGRLELAQAIASRDNPLTARVIVNRVWLHHFGKGIVRTPSDFGTRGDPPTPPRTARLARRALHGGRLVGQEAAQADPAVGRLPAVERRRTPTPARLDPENLLLWQHEPPAAGFRGDARFAAGRRRHAGRDAWAAGR